MHGAMQVYAGNARAVRREHGPDFFRVIDIRGALVMNNDVKAARVIRVA